ncbi:MAG: cation-transporting P-type ATPase, partial [Gammaproteobacteria bacterium]|nr:cation-transporting P-type ATPase [Gammaproteobacteria bacterium]
MNHPVEIDVAWHSLSPEEVVARLESDARAGLSAEEAAARLAQAGPNALAEGHRRSLLL